MIPNENADRVLAPVHMKEAEFQRTVWVLDAQPGVRPQDVLAQDFWAHLSAKMKVYDRIEIRGHGGLWYAEVMVLEASRQWAKVILMAPPLYLASADVSQTQAFDANAQAARPSASDFEVMHRGPRKWSVVRRSDRQMLHEGEQTKDGAQAWLDKYAANSAVAA